MYGVIGCLLIPFFIFRRLDVNASEFEEGGEFVVQDQDPGNFADQGKPSYDHNHVLNFISMLLLFY